MFRIGIRVGLAAGVGSGLCRWGLRLIGRGLLVARCDRGFSALFRARFGGCFCPWFSAWIVGRADSPDVQLTDNGVIAGAGSGGNDEVGRNGRSLGLMLEALSPKLRFVARHAEVHTMTRVWGRNGSCANARGQKAEQGENRSEDVRVRTHRSLSAPPMQM